jgi:hypothetical protein
MSFDTFCGQEPTDPNTYQKVLTRFLPPLGILAVNAGANIDIPNPALPVISVANPLNATLNFGVQSLQDSGGGVGAAGQFLSSGAGGQTLWANQTNPVVNTTNANAVVYPVFVDGGGGVPRQLLTDDGATPISVNCATGDFIVVDTIRVQSAGAVAVGKSIASVAPQQASAIAVGLNAARDNQGGSAVAIGATCGDISQGANAVAIGANAGRDTQGLNSVALGILTGEQNQGANATAVGNNAGNNTQGASAVAVGYNAADTNQGTNAVSVGHNCGENNQSSGAVAMGFDAAQNNQGVNSVAIGREAGQETQGLQAVAVGGFAGEDTQSANATAVGYQAGQTTQGASAVAVGFQSGQTNQSSNAVSVGRLAGNANQLVGAIAIGNTAGQTSQQTSAIAIGVAAGNNTQSANAVAIGNTAGQTNQSVRAVAVGFGAGVTTQGQEAVAVGDDAGNNNQGASAVAVGNGAGTTTQGQEAVAVGDDAGNNNQGASAVAVGNGAGTTTQGASAVAVGNGAGTTTQGASAVAVGVNAGNNNQGANAVAIGNLAGQTNQTAGSIAINATGVALNTTTAGLYIDPIRFATGFNTLSYDTTTKEITSSQSNDATIFEDFVSNTSSVGDVGSNLIMAESGGGNSTIFAGIFKTALAVGSYGRRGVIQLNSGGGGGNGTFIKTPNIFSIWTLSKVEFGIAPSAGSNLATASTAQGFIRQAVGITPTVSQDNNQTNDTIIWRLTSGNAVIPAWQFVINNSVQFTITTDTDATDMWIRCGFTITPNQPANTFEVQGFWYNLTAGTLETTPVVVCGAGQPAPLDVFSADIREANQFGIYAMSGTENATNKYMALDYVLLNQANLYPLLGTTEATGR